MLYNNVQIFAPYLQVIDALTLGLSALILRWMGERWWHWNASDRLPMVVFASSVLVAFVVLAGKMRAYHPRRTERSLSELTSILGVAISSLGVACLLTQSLTAGLPGSVYLAASLTSIGTLILLRGLIRIGLRALRRKGRDHRTWLLVGRNPRSERVARYVLERPHFGIRIAGIADLPPKDGCPQPACIEPFLHPPLSAVPQWILREPEELRETLSRGLIDEVVISLPLRSRYDETMELIRMCWDAGIAVTFSPEVFPLSAREKAQVGQVGDVPLVTHFSGPANPGSLMVKRLLDMLVAATGLIVCFPLHLVIATAIKLSSPGPVFFRQTRSGLHGRPFRMIKYRTMTVDAPSKRKDLAALNETDGPAFKIRHDPRIHPVGRWLRKYHLDELPQLWNVLAGNMSLVGPRPLPVEEATGTAWWQRRRLAMPPGLTCIWQAEGDHRLSFARWMELDLEYIDRWSLALDFRLLLATVWTVARGTGW